MGLGADHSAPLLNQPVTQLAWSRWPQTHVVLGNGHPGSSPHATGTDAGFPAAPLPTPKPLGDLAGHPSILSLASRGLW